MSNKYEAAIRAMELLVDLSKRPEHQLRDDEMAFKEKMFNKEVEANFISRELDFYRTKIANVEDRIRTIQGENDEIKQKIHAANGKIDDIPDYVASGNAKSFPKELYKSYQQNNVEMIKTSWEEAQRLQEEYNQLKWNNQHLDKDLLEEIKTQATKNSDYEDQLRAAKLTEIKNRINATNLARQIEYDDVTGGKPEDYLNNVEAEYGNIADQIETVFTAEGILEMLEGMPGYELMSKEDKSFIAKGANLMLYNNSSGASFLESLDAVDPSIKSFWLDPMNPYAGSMKNILDNDYLYDKAIDDYANLYSQQQTNAAIANPNTNSANNNNNNNKTSKQYNITSMKKNRSNVNFGGND